MFEWFFSQLGLAEGILVVIGVCACVATSKITKLVGKLEVLEGKHNEYVEKHDAEVKEVKEMVNGVIEKDRDNRDKIYNQLNDIAKALAFIQGQFDNAKLDSN